MLVKDWMNKTVIRIEEDRSKMDAIRLLREHNIRMLPVVKAGKLVGVVTRGGLQRVSAVDAGNLEVHELFYNIAKTRVKDVMTDNPVTVPHDFTLEEAAEILFANRIKGAPVVDGEGNIAGIITLTDLFGVFISLTGVGAKGVQFALTIADQPGSFREVDDTIRKYGCRMRSMLRSYEGVQEGFCKVFIRIHDLDRTRLPELTEELKGKGTLMYMVDQREMRREIF